MSFMKSLIKPIAQIGASFIPGVGPIASSLIGGIGGAAADAYGRSGKQGQQRSSSTTNTNQTETGRSTSSQETGGSYRNEQQAIEDPLMSMFRQSVIGGLSDATSRAREPIYGDREKASFLNDLNDLAGGATSALRGQLAGRGALDSGQLEQGAGQIQNQRLSEAVKYFSQIPALNRQYSDQNEQNLLGLSANLAGRAPISTIQSGTSQQSSTGQQDFNSTRQGTSETDGLQEMFGPSFGKGLLNNLGGLGGALFGNALAGGFGGRQTGNPTGLDLFNPTRTRNYMDMLNPYGRR
jgi:hypothetical protein